MDWQCQKLDRVPLRWPKTVWTRSCWSSKLPRAIHKAVSNLSTHVAESETLPSPCCDCWRLPKVKERRTFYPPFADVRFSCGGGCWSDRSCCLALRQASSSRGEEHAVDNAYRYADISLNRGRRSFVCCVVGYSCAGHTATLMSIAPIGGNIDVPVIGRVLERGLAADGRLVKLSIDVPDRPGSIARLTKIAAEVG
jgi:hypothetical protein